MVDFAGNPYMATSLRKRRPAVDARMFPGVVESIANPKSADEYAGLASSRLDEIAREASLDGGTVGRVLSLDGTQGLDRGGTDAARDGAADAAALAGLPLPEATLLTRGGLLANALLNNPYTQKALIGRYGNADAGSLRKGVAAMRAGQQAMRDARRGR